jgi:S-formylglutathione hydrolase FrmB
MTGPAVVFRTFELSDARFDGGGLRCITVKSPALAQRADITFYVPVAARGRTDVPLVILLHGVYGSHWAWALRGGAHRTLDRLQREEELPPFVLAMPSDGLWGDGSGYLPQRTQDFERWIVSEVPAAVAQAVPEVTAESPRFIAGLSMGGFGALRLAGKYPGRFRAASGHSSLTEFVQLRAFVEESLGTFTALDEDRSVLDVLLRNRSRLPALRFDCGTSDPLLPANRALHTALVEAGIAHDYEEFAGGHEWTYWEAHLADTLRFFAHTLNLTP